jgi:hypothetical protein
MIDWMVADPFQCHPDCSRLTPCKYLAGLAVDEHKLDMNGQRRGRALTVRSVPGQVGSLLGGAGQLRCGCSH